MVKKRRGQMEILGILLVIILLIIGLLFFLRFGGGTSGREEVSKTIRNKEIAANMVISLMDTETPCRGLDVEELVRNCAMFCTGDCNPTSAEDGMVVCSTPSGPVHSCQYVKDTFQTLFTQTLETWHVGYEFEMVIERPGIEGLDSDELLSFNPDACKKGSDTEPIQTSMPAGRIISKLRICQ